MTVREYIEYLKTLDQDKGIWVLYDGGNYEDSGYAAGIFEPTVDKDTVLPPLAEYVNKWYNNNVKEGDYLISIGWYVEAT